MQLSVVTELRNIEYDSRILRIHKAKKIIANLYFKAHTYLRILKLREAAAEHVARTSSYPNRAPLSRRMSYSVPFRKCACMDHMSLLSWS